MVQVLPGFAPQLGQNLASIVGSIQHVIDPDYEVKQMIKQKAMADPNYAQMLGNFAYTNPDLYKQLGFGKIGEVIGGISPDLKTVMEEAQKGFVASEAKSGNKELQKEGAQKKLYGKTEIELQNEKLANVQAGINIALSKQRGTLNEQQIKEGEAQLQQIQLGIKGVEDALGNYEGLKGMKLGQLADDFLSGKANGALMSQIFSTPQLSKPFQEILEFKKQERSLSNQLRVASYSHALGQKNIDNDIWLRSGGIGTPALWNKYRSDSKTQQRLYELIADPKKAETPEDQMLLQMHESISSKQNGANAKIAMQAISAMNKAASDINKPGVDVEARRNQLNVIFDQLAQATGDIYQAVMEEEVTPAKAPWFGRNTPEKRIKKLRIIDQATGKEVKPGEIAARASGVPTIPRNDNDPATPAPPVGVDTAKVNNAFRKIMSANITDDKKKKAIDKSTELSQLEKDELYLKLGLKK